MIRAAALLSLLVSLFLPAGCSVAVRGSKLSNRPHDDRGIYLSTGTADRPFHTLGFVQVRGYGVEVAGAADYGDAALDSAIRGHLSREAARMGGDGVIHIEFLDENPSTPAERAQAASQSLQNFQNQQGGPKTKSRYVTVTGEIVKFHGDAP